VGSGQASTIRRLRAAREAAVDACAARDRFNAIAAHELRQPLAALLMQADLLRRLGVQRADDQLQELGEDMRSSLRRQARLIEDLLDVSRVRVGKLRLEIACVDIGSLVSRVTTAMAATAPSVRVRTDIPPAGTLRCHADPIRVEQIVSNLLENALKFAGAHGTVEVRAMAEDGFARIVVMDTGRGIAPSCIGGIFDLFAQPSEPTSRTDKGMGIGLALVNELAQAHGGHVRARSAGPNLGAEFSVWLPLAASSRTIEPSATRGTATASTPPMLCPTGSSGRRRTKQRGNPGVRTSI